MSVTEEVKACAFEMFAGGASVNKVAEALLKNHWAGAKKLHVLWKQGGGVVTGGGEEVKRSQKTAQKKRSGKRLPGAKDQVAAADEDIPEEWELTVKVRTADVDTMLAALTLQEKVNAVAYVLQSRLNEACA